MTMEKMSEDRHPHDHRNPYEKFGEPPRLKRSVTAYLDILGYRDLIDRAFKEGRAEEELKKLRLALNASYEIFRERSPTISDVPKVWELRAFTDNIVLGCPLVFGEEAGAEMFHVFFTLAAFQFEMLRRGFFLRGGIAVGDLYMDSEIVFGPALLEAYKAEDCLARDPRIVLAPSAVNQTQIQLARFASVERSPHFRSLLKDADGQIFLDYLEETVLIAVDESGPFFNALTEHKKIVEAKLVEFKKNPRIWSKYAWVANYHNFFCERYSHFNDSHKIDASKLRAGPGPTVLG